MTPRIRTAMWHALTALASIALLVGVLTAVIQVLQPGVQPDVLADDSPTTTVDDAGVEPTPIGLPTTTLPPATSSTTSTTVPDETTCDSKPSATEATTLLRVYYPCGAEPFPDADTWVYRAVPETPQVLTATLGQMVAGPTQEEREAGFRSPFNEATADALRNLSLSDGKAVVDLARFDGIETIAADEDRTRDFLAMLNANVFQFETISTVEYRLDGDCDAFWSLFGGTCEDMTRSRWNSQLAQWRRLNG